ncbi:MobA/MobL family protein [Dyella sp. ASV21]|uniref:MobA/MobL family protein n=1 Tax=Dyella sp. ASV21 TaxID=2795114 RepID=UPI0018EE04EB|nr:MobA/MobL family protein [Dyella sp. ASV21]
MTLHARPHLSTHGRSDGHSAVAGVAYRLGLRLYDERAKKWHDFRQRRLGDHIADALTIVPDGAPEWATDPQMLWNAVEAAEKRKDAQLARDYRIPIPLGVGLEEAKQMAIAVARQIVERLHTPVSIGLHRDATKTALGLPKPAAKRGYHAHLYFPTRALEEIGQADGSSAWGLGTKFSFLTNKRTSAGFVEGLNAAWADLANHFAQVAGLTATYDHRSYVRMGLDVEPQRTLGAAVTAMERRGFWTRKGEELRGQIVVESEVLRVSQADALEAQHAQAVQDVIRECVADQLAGLQVAQEEVAAVVQQTPVTVDEVPASDLPSPGAADALPDGEPGSLLHRFRQAVPVPEDPDALRVYVQVVGIIRLVERVLSALANLVSRKSQHEEDRSRRVMARLDAEFQVDQARRRRTAAREHLQAWEEEHPVRMAAAKAAGRKPAEWVSLNDVVDQEDTKVQEAKAARQLHMTYMEAIDQAGAQIVTEENVQKKELSQALDGIQQLSPILVTKLLSVSDQGERAWLEAAKPSEEQQSHGEALPAVLPRVEKFEFRRHRRIH